MGPPASASVTIFVLICTQVRELVQSMQRLWVAGRGALQVQLSQPVRYLHSGKREIACLHVDTKQVIESSVSRQTTCRHDLDALC